MEVPNYAKRFPTVHSTDFLKEKIDYETRVTQRHTRQLK